MRLSAIDRKVLNSVQEDIPLIREPFKRLSKRVGIKEDEFIKRVKRLKDKGFIRSFGAGLNHKKLRFNSSLIALRVPLGRLESIVEEIIKYEEVTHCYLREGEYNLWIVFLTLKKKVIKTFLNRLSKEIGRDNILNLPTKRQFKLKTKLKI